MLSRIHLSDILSPWTQAVEPSNVRSCTTIRLSSSALHVGAPSCRQFLLDAKETMQAPSILSSANAAATVLLVVVEQSSTCPFDYIYASKACCFSGMAFTMRTEQWGSRHLSGFQLGLRMETSKHTSNSSAVATRQEARGAESWVSDLER